MGSDKRTTRREGRLMGLDLGRVRIGVAMTDELGLAAMPHATLPSRGMERDLARLTALAREMEIVTVVVGIPYQLDGSVGEQTDTALRFSDRLAEALPDVAVVRWDERLTTSQAERVLLEADLSRKRRRQVVDRLAATLILGSYLEASRSGSGDRDGAIRDSGDHDDG